MKIGIVTTWWNGAGASEVSLAFSKILLSQGNDVRIYARNEHAVGTTLPLEFDHSRFSVTNGAQSMSPLVKSINIRHFLNFVRKENLEVVIFNEQVDLSPVIELKKIGIRCIAYVDYYREDTVKTFEIYDALICNTRRHFEVFKWHPNAWFLPWGIDTSIYENILPTSTDSQFPFFHSCSYDPKRKGTDILLQSLAESDELRCLIHAYPALSVTLPEYTQMIETLKAEGKLSEINRLVRQPGLYSLGKIYVYPSRLEGIGLSILESLASGLYLVAPNTEPFSEFALSFGSSLVPIDRWKARSDAYFWPIAEISPEALKVSMLDALKKVRENPSCHKEIQDHILENRDIFKTHQELSTLIKNLKFTSIQKSKIEECLNASSQKVPVAYKGQIRKTIFLVWLLSRKLRSLIN